MKKLLSFLIVISILLSLIGCVNTNVPSNNPVTSSSNEENNTTDDESDDTSGSTNNSTLDSTTNSSSNDTNNSTNDNENTDNGNTGGNTGGSTERPKPTIVPDRTKYVAETVGSGNEKYIYYIYDLIKHPVMAPYYNGYKSALTMTFDDGYDLGTGTIVSDQFEKYGFKGTAMISACWMNEEAIEAWNKVFARGYLNLGCHGYNHKNPEGLSTSEYEHEIKDAIMFLREKFPGQRVLTYATPFAHINDSYEEYLRDLVIGNREESGGGLVNLKNSLDFNPYRVKAFSVNKNVRLQPIHDAVQTGVEYGNWTVELLHCVVPEGGAGTDITQEVFEYHCEYLYRHFRDTVWFATFEEVLVYAEQLKHISIEYTACDRNSMTFKVTPDGTLDKELYNIPMSVIVYLPGSFADSAYALVNGEYQDLEVVYEKETQDTYATVRNISFLEETEIVVYMGGNKTMKNNCTHRYSVDSVVEPTHETFGYTVNKCSKCEHTYNSAYTGLKHDYTGEEVVVIEPTKSENGLSKYYCTQCDKYEVREVAYTE